MEDLLMAYNFPWQMFAESEQRKRQQKLDNLQAINDIFKTTGDTAAMFGKRHQQKLMMDQIANDPDLKKYAAFAEMNPDVFMQNVLPKLLGDKARIMSGSGDLASVYQDPVTGETSNIPKPGWIERRVSQGMALQYTKPKMPMSGLATPAGQKYLTTRATQAEVSALGQIEKDLDPSTASRTTPVGAAASSVRRAINGLSLLQQPVVTRTALEATMGDIDSILTQASATVEGRKMLSTPNFLMNVAKFRSFVSDAPDKTSVPQGMVKLYQDILNDLGPISERFIKDRVEQQWNLRRPQALKLTPAKEYEALKERILKGYSIQEGLKKQEPGKLESDPLGIMQ